MLLAEGSAAREQVHAGYAELLSRVPWSLFVTYTTDPKRVAHMGFESWRKSIPWHLRTWLAESAIRAGLARRPYPDHPERLRGPWANRWRAGKDHPQFAIAIEPHRDDRPHAHALVRMPAGVPVWLDWKLGCDLWWKHHGRCWFELPRSVGDCCGYVAKYVTKCGSDAISFSDNFEAPRMGNLS